MSGKQFEPRVGVGWRPGTAGPGTYLPPEVEPGSLGTVALLLALGALVLSCVAGSSPGMAVAALVSALGAGVLAVIAMVRRRSDAGRATAGLMVSMACLLVMLIALAAKSPIGGGGG